MPAADLFPETLGELGPIVAYESKDFCDQYGNPRIVVRLVPKWDDKAGLWTVGWFCNVENAVDEWFPGAGTPANYPWYRTQDQPAAKQLAVACATAARAVKFVLLQMLAYTDSAEVGTNTRRIEAQLEDQARRWFLGEDTI